jgi:hypothetical protein
MALLLNLTVLFVAIAVAMYLGIGHPSQFVFDPVSMKVRLFAARACHRSREQEIANKAIQQHGTNAAAVIDSVVAQLRQKYPEFVKQALRSFSIQCT